MQINLERLLGKEAAARIHGIGLHKLAAARLAMEGHRVPRELDLRSAVQALGTNLYIKNAEYKSVIEGLRSFESLQG